ncbi:hypothetical protein TNCV_4635151 [Trichonephila clavipes]|nr:hypothetical protein TNCV_4635151 [Trichonephila clavipes]
MTQSTNKTEAPSTLRDQEVGREIFQVLGFYTKRHRMYKEFRRLPWMELMIGGKALYQNILTGLDCLVVLLEEFIAVDDDNICTSPILADKDILEFVESSKNIIDADSNDENKINIAASISTSSKMRLFMKSISSYLDTHSNGDVNKKIDDIEPFLERV